MESEMSFQYIALVVLYVFAIGIGSLSTKF
jgi:hypothetical protein